MPNVDVNGTVVQFPDSMSDAEIAAAIRDNPSQFQAAPAPSVSTPSIDRHDEGPAVIVDRSGISPVNPFSVAGQVYKAAIEPAYRAVVEPITNAVASQLRGPSQNLALPPEVAQAMEKYDIGEPTAQALAKIVVPQTPVQAATIAALGGVNKAATALYTASPGSQFVEKLGELALRYPGWARTAATAPISALGSLLEGKSTSDTLRDAAINTLATGGAETLSRTAQVGIPQKAFELGVQGLDKAAEYGSYWAAHKYGPAVGFPARKLAEQGAALLAALFPQRWISSPGAQTAVRPFVQSAIDAAAQRGVQQFVE